MRLITERSAAALLYLALVATAGAEDGWLDATQKSAVAGGANITIASAQIGNVPLKKLSGDLTLSDDKYLMILLVVENKSDTKKINLNTFAGTFAAALDHTGPTLTDNFGNTYKVIDFPGKDVGMQADNTSIYPGKSATDLIVFELPVDKVESLKLEMAGKNVGANGTLRFEIPASMIQHKEREPKPAPVPRAKPTKKQRAQ